MSLKQRMTAEQLWAMPEVPGKRFELVRGELVEVPGSGGTHSVLVQSVYDILKPFVRAHDLGMVFPDGLTCILAREPDLLRIPDVSFVSRARIPESGVPQGYWPGAPDVAVEIVSPNDTARELHAKVREYLDAGTRIVFVMWPDERSLTAHDASGQVRELGPDDEFDFGDVLPSFRIRVGDLFESD
jgi:Uma2 family endonuclease